jgi:hypothetical protein
LTVNLIDGKTIELSGICPLEDAEILLQYLLENTGTTLDWTKCEEAHTAVIQILMASKCALIGPPAGLFLKAYIEPALLRAGGQIRPFTTGPEVRKS